MTRINWNDLKYFKKSEFKSPGRMSASLLYKLSLIRADAGVPICVTSSFRKGDSGSHGEGLAVDISDNMQSDPVTSSWRFKVLNSIFKLKFNRIGIYPKHIHLDMSESRAQDVCWWAENKP